MAYVYEEDLREKFNAISKMSTWPNKDKFPRYREGHIIDKDQTVRWNETEVAKCNAAWKAERARLIKDVNTAEAEFFVLCCEYIRKGTDLTDVQADLICKKANEHHEDWYSFISHVDEYTDFANELIAAGKNR